MNESEKYNIQLSCMNQEGVNFLVSRMNHPSRTIREKYYDFKKETGVSFFFVLKHIYIINKEVESYVCESRDY